MADDPIYQLLSTESETPRPRTLCTGPLAACLDELKEAVLHDVVASNRGELRIVAIFRDAVETDAGARRDLTLDVFKGRTTGQGY